MRVEKLEAAGVGPGGGSQGIKTLHLQLEPLDAANKSLVFNGVCGVNLERRTRKLEAILSETVGGPKPVGVEHAHKGKRDERAPTKVSLFEFRNRADREVALQLLSDKESGRQRRTISLQACAHQDAKITQ